MQRNSKPVTWRGKGLSDALDASDAFDGSMLSLQNLIPDPSTARLWQCRPAAQKIFDFFGGAFSSGFSGGFSGGFGGGPTTRGPISVMKQLGGIVYGMVANPSGALAGFDSPFAFNLITNAQIPVTGTQNSTTLPQTLAATGAWVPPQMDIIGTKLMVCHQGFVGTGGNFVGWFDLSTPTAPVWNAGTLTATGGGSGFSIAPTGVVQFFNRAYYIHNAVNAPAVLFSDVLSPTTFTALTGPSPPNILSNVLTFGDQVPLTALGALPLSNQLGGIIQSVMVFKNTTCIYQITGDPIFGAPATLTTQAQVSSANGPPLQINTLNVATGTLAPNSICATPKGLAFMAQDGLRIIDFNANVSDPIGLDGKGVCVPFIFSVVPSRVCAACNASVLRITTQNGNLSNNPLQEYWLDFGRGIFTGPHTSTASLIVTYRQTFIMQPTAVPGQLWQSDVFQSATSLFVENGATLQWAWQTTLLPDTDQMVNVCVTESTLDLSLPPTTAPIIVNASDQNGSVINQVSVTPPTAAATVWGSFTWGGATWGGGIAAALAPYQLKWSIPLVFARGTIAANGQSAGSLRVGALHARYQILRQLTNTQAAA